ncbi:MAG: response regulator [Clostridium sp.]|nr:MAG: response regulator [Clostridium sp.]
MMLPDYSGSEILKIIRSNPKYDDVDIIIVSANRMVMDKVDGLDLGADDYIERLLFYLN